MALSGRLVFSPADRQKRWSDSRESLAYSARALHLSLPSASARSTRIFLSGCCSCCTHGLRERRQHRQQSPSHSKQAHMCARLSFPPA
eukprot:763642-Hanusia_phi.AAC.2